MSNENLICPICGKPTSVWYGNARKDKLCREHAQQLKEGLIEQCPDCGKWHETGKPCECKNKIAKHTENANSNELTCIICGEPSNGKHFCYNCYKKYANKVLYLKVLKCKEFEKLEALNHLADRRGINKCQNGARIRICFRKGGCQHLSFRIYNTEIYPCYSLKSVDRILQYLI